MPTNLIRQKLEERPKAAARKRAPAPERQAVLTAGRVSVRIRLLQTRTADLIWSALPLHSIVETWGDSIHFDTPLRIGRCRRWNKLEVDAFFRSSTPASDEPSTPLSPANESPNESS